MGTSKAKTEDDVKTEEELNAEARTEPTSMDVVEVERDVPDHEKRRLWREKLHREIEGEIPGEDGRFVLDPSVNPENIIVRDTLIGLQVQYKTLAHTVVDQVGTEEGLAVGALTALADSLNKAVEDIVTNQRPDMFNV